VIFDNPQDCLICEIYIFGAVGDKDELIKCCGQEVKVQAHDETRCGQKLPVHKCTFPARAYQSTFLREGHFFCHKQLKIIIIIVKMY